MDTDTRYVRYFKMEAIRYKMNAFSWSTEMGRKSLGSLFWASISLNSSPIAALQGSLSLLLQ